MGGREGRELSYDLGMAANCDLRGLFVNVVLM